MLKSGIVVVGLGLALAACPVCEALAPETEEAEAETTRIETGGAEKEEMTREDLLETIDQVHGKRGRRLFKTAYWAAGLEGDMKEIYDSYGYPSSRYREIKAGIKLEKWTYLDAGKQFIFRNGRLARTRNFNPGSALGIYLK